MSGTVIEIRKMGVKVQFSPDDTVSGNYNVIRQSDSSVACTVSPWKQMTGTTWNLNWVGDPPQVLPSVGDTLVPV